VLFELDFISVQHYPTCAFSSRPLNFNGHFYNMTAIGPLIEFNSIRKLLD
jgi:hypothetical protein